MLGGYKLLNVGEGKDNSGEIEQILEKFAIVFKEPRGLPPSREVDHKIPFKIRVDLVNVRPHRYSRLQKDDIEKKIKDMLH